ncbi:flavohemo protein [Biscogniauxia mediterranea]|nr:flavohemo protein [Biscogniauxia mediterranea]
MAAPLTPSQIATVKATAPVLKEHGTTITKLFYDNIISDVPELKNIFNLTNQASGAQPRALAAAVCAYATYVDDLAQLESAVELIAHKHASLNIQPEHYPLVGKYLLNAVAKVLGDACTPEIAEAWTAAYAALADIFINREKQIYDTYDDWKGWRKFKIQKKVPEASGITSFYLVPEDGSKLPTYLSGQYISLRVQVPQLGHLQPRQYSLSDAPNTDHYRISVKKEGRQEDASALVSNLLHDDYKEGDVVEITHPTGDFFVDSKEDSKTPIALISAGVGITPMISILNTAVASGSSRPISLLHGAHSSEARAFKETIKDAVAKHSNVKAKIFLTTTQAQETQGVDYHFTGRMDLGKVDQQGDLFIGDASAQYYVSGPSSFMKDVRKYLTDAGVGAERIHLEVFGTGGA